MRMEHTALNVADPVAMADWYVKHLNMRIVRSTGEPVFARFITDGSGQSMIEIYHNDRANVPDYAAIHPLVLHLAFASEDVDADATRLATVGASIVDEPFSSDGGDRLAMLRDPWGLALQLVNRSNPML